MVSAAFRVDAGASIGGGHLMRCSALAVEMAERGWTTCLCGSAQTIKSADSLQGFAAWVSVDGAGLVDADALPGGHDIVVIDHYGLGHDYENRARRRARLVVAISDFPEQLRGADIVVDQNFGHTADHYRNSVTIGCTVLAGSSYVMLGPAYRLKGHRPPTPKPRHAAANLLVTFGASDPQDMTGLVLRILREAAPSSWRIRAVLGPYYARADAVEHMGRRWSALSIERAPHDLSASMTWADAAIAAVGGTLWELCFMGVPFAVLTAGAASHPTAQCLQQDGVAIDLGPSQSLTAELLMAAVTSLVSDHERSSSMATRAFRLIDGRGAARICDAIENALQSR